MSIKQTDNTGLFIKFLLFARKDTLEKMGQIGNLNIKATTPRDTGFLLDHQRYEIKGNKLYFVNDTLYATYVELGTYKQYANPFMRRGIRSSYPQFAKVIKTTMSV